MLLPCIKSLFCVRDQKSDLFYKFVFYSSSALLQLELRNFLAVTKIDAFNIFTFKINFLIFFSCLSTFLCRKLHYNFFLLFIKLM